MSALIHIKVDLFKNLKPHWYQKQLFFFICGNMNIKLSCRFWVSFLYTRSSLWRIQYRCTSWWGFRWMCGCFSECSLWFTWWSTVVGLLPCCPRVSLQPLPCLVLSHKLSFQCISCLLGFSSTLIIYLKVRTSISSW